MLRRILWSGLTAILLAAALVAPAAAAGGDNARGAPARIAAGQTVVLQRDFASAADWYVFLAYSDATAVGFMTADCCLVGDEWAAAVWGGSGKWSFTVSPADRVDTWGPHAMVASSWALGLVYYVHGIDVFPAGMSVNFHTHDGSQLEVLEVASSAVGE